MSRDGLGELEHQTMLALLHLDADAYTAPIVEELESRTGRETSVAAVYIVLRRLEEKGLVASELRDPGPEGGRDRRYFEVTAEGLEKLRHARRAYDALWDGLEGRLGPQVGKGV
jgi:DNA-binding PadR family transcriptional regulator